MAIDPASSSHDLAEHLLDHNYPIERETMADVSALLAQVASVHGARHPELHALEATWAELCGCLARHLRDERSMLAPHVEQQTPPAPVPGPRSGAMASQHKEVLGLVRRVRELTGGYAPPADACDAYRALLASLAEFEEDVHEHVELADNVLRR